MIKGYVFDIKEYSINDGPGIRTTVFLKGCPLRCKWCHNPEGLTSVSQYNLQTKQFVGEEWTAEELANRLLAYSDLFNKFTGGITFSGGEPTMQHEFLIACVEHLHGIHKLLDTCGYCNESDFEKITRYFDAFYYDLKLVDDKTHKEYTGVSNEKIICNLKLLASINKSLTIRMPMIPNITDTEMNLDLAAQLIQSICSTDIEIHLLPYNKLAGGKYPIYNMDYPLKNGYVKNKTRNIINFSKIMTSANYIVRNYVEEENDG